MKVFITWEVTNTLSKSMQNHGYDPGLWHPSLQVFLCLEKKLLSFNISIFQQWPGEGSSCCVRHVAPSFFCFNSLPLTLQVIFQLHCLRPRIQEFTSFPHWADPVQAWDVFFLLVFFFGRAGGGHISFPFAASPSIACSSNLFYSCSSFPWCCRCWMNVRLLYQAGWPTWITIVC